MEELRRRHESVREEITRVIATLRALLQDPEWPTVDIRRQLRLVNGTYVEIKALDERIPEDIDDDEFDTDFAASYDLCAEVVEVRTHVAFAIPSAAVSDVVAKDPRARDPDFAIIQYGKAAALSGEGKMTAQAEKLVNAHATCEPCSGTEVLIAGEDCARPGWSRSARRFLSRTD